VAARHRPVREHEIGPRVPTEPVRPIPVRRKRKSGEARLLPGSPDPEKPQRQGADALHNDVLQTRVRGQVTDKVSEFVSVATAEGVVEAANESLLSRPWTAASPSSRNAPSRSASETRTGGNVPRCSPYSTGGGVPYTSRRFICVYDGGAWIEASY
jgi:hypothetical protein